ncbi:hypothetical protein FHS16_001737 [Paenibacillus endophyticus]|uniref:Uncharacterized protein n=1 Tax=Paenibacillus endophyticus TaxID=1294268 RepID=A0A7W5G9I5_9BACL|nr:hypothetical protein [Paenibacillus endophyticus]MBB3151691.1 hypothetical protein [Paenibacillus endophyticus]
MKKRLRKKLGLPWKQQHNVLLNSIRLSRKKHKNSSWNVLKYSLLPIGDHDYKSLISEYWDEENQISDYSFASHWLIAVYCFDYNSFRILTFPCSSDGNSPTISPVRIADFGRLSSNEGAYAGFDEASQQILNDIYWV